jgi:hypothetical protein
MRTVGTVREIHRYPLKSAAGEQLAAVEVTAAGLEHDRRWALATPAGEPVTAREAPALRDVSALLDGGQLAVRVPGADPVAGQGALAALAQVAGTPVRWEETGTSHVDVAAVHLVSAGAASADDAPGGCDPEPRANLVLDLEAGPGAERAWVGRRLRVGSAELQVTRTPKRCLGVYAEVLVAGRVEVGDAVRLAEA